MIRCLYRYSLLIGYAKMENLISTEFRVSIYYELCLWGRGKEYKEWWPFREIAKTE